MGKLTLALLGTPLAALSGRPVIFPTRKVLAALIYLVLEGGIHRREKVAALFWPEQAGPQGRQVLRTTLARLRQALQDGGDDQHSTAYLVIDQHTVGFNFHSAFDLDVQTLELATHVSDLGASEVDRAEWLALLQRAVASYRGDFLDGFVLPDAPAFDDWVAVRRERYHRQFATILERLSQHQFDAGAVGAAIDTAARWIAHDPLDETAHRRLMQLHFAAGDRAAALRAYEACRAVLAAELGAEPVPETVALVEQLRTNAPPPRRQAHLPHLAVEPPVLDPPLVGREKEHIQLVEAFRSAVQGQLQVVCLAGEAGIGKSRLVREFLGWAAAQAADILPGQAFETGGQVPYQPLVQAVRPRLDRENAPDDLLADVWLAELSRLLPELRDRYPDLPPPLADDTTARTRLFEAFARLGVALAERAPLMLCIDDLQWADAATLDLLHYAGHRWCEAGVPVLLLLILRSEALASSATLAEWVESMACKVSLTRLMLGPLTADETERLVQSLALPVATVAQQDGAEAQRTIHRFSQWLFAETGGQPFFLVETLQALVEQGVLSPHVEATGTRRLDFSAALRDLDGQRSLIPSRVREVIRSRLDRVSAPARALLSAGAVLGQRFGFAQLCRVANLDDDTALPALDEVLRGQLFRRDETGRSRFADPIYIFAHDKIRDVVYTEAGDARRLIFHRRAFEMLQATFAPPATLAHHALHGGLLEAAFRCSLAAGDAAMRLFAVRDAIGYYEQARQILAELSDDQSDAAAIATADLQALYSQLGRAYELTNAFTEARATYQEMLAQARALHDAQIEWAALNHLITISTLMFDLDSTPPLLQQARHLAERIGDKAGLAELEWNLAQASFYRLDFAASLAHGGAALMLARELGQIDLIARSLNVIAYANLGCERWADVEAAATEAQALYAALGNRAMEADCLCQITAARINCGHTAAGVSAGRAARAISLEIDNAWGQVHSAVQLTPGLLDMGALTEALAVAQHGVDMARAQGIHMLPACLARLGTVYRALLDLDAARAIHLEALGLDAQNPHRPFTALIAAELCADMALVGSWEEAYRYALQAAAARVHTLLDYGFTIWLEVEALLREGAGATASSILSRLSERIGDNQRYRIPYLRALAVVAQSQGHSADALGHLEAAGALAHELGLPSELWQIYAARGDLYLERRDRDRALQAFAQASAILEMLAQKIEDPALRTGFLAADRLQHVLDVRP